MGLLCFSSAGQFSSSWTTLFRCLKEAPGYVTFPSGIRNSAQNCSCWRGRCLTRSEEELVEQGTYFWLAGSLSGHLPSHTLCLTVPARG